MSEQEPVEKDPEKKDEVKKKRGCLGWLLRCSLVLLLLIAGLLLWFNGPGFRWLAHRYGPELLEEAGFSGEFAVSGTLLGGPTIERLSLSSETSPLKSLEAENLVLQYNPLDLKNLKVESLTADRLVVDLDLAQSSEKPQEEKEPSNQTLEETLTKYRELALYPEIQIAELDLHVHKAEQNFYQVAGARLAHTAGTELIEFSPGTLTDFQDDTSTPPVAGITWGSEQIEISQLPVAKDLGVARLTFTPEPLLADGVIRLFESDLTFDSDLRSQVRTQLSGAPLDLAPFLALAPSAEGIAAKVTQLDINSENLDQDFNQWEIALELAVDDVVVDGREIPQTTFKLTKSDLIANAKLRIALDGETQPEMDLTTTFAEASSAKVGEAWKNSTSVVRTEFASLQTLLEGLSPTLNLPDPPDGWPEGRAGLTANVRLENGEVAPSTATFDFANLNWAGVTFREGQLIARYRSPEEPLEAELSIIQSEESTLSTTASFLPETQAYKASFQANSFQAGALEPFIRLSVGDVPLSGVINLAWEGSGELPDTGSHTGKLSLNQTSLAVKDQPEITIDLAAEYNGLSNIALNQLSVTQGDQQLETELHWDGERIEIPNLLIVKSGKEIVTGQVSVPFQKDQDPSQYFTNDNPWQVDLNADRLNIPETAQLFGAALPEGLQGILTLDTSVGGSPANPSLSGKVRLEGFSLESVSQLPATDADVSWATAGNSLTLDGTVTPEGRNSITLNGNTQFFPKKWAENPESFLEEEFTAQVNAPNVNLAPFAELSPLVELLEGSLKAQVTANGTFRSPNVNGSVEVDLPKGRFDIERLRRVRQTSLKVSLEGDTVRISPSSLSTDGGIIGLSGTVGIQDTANPAFDLQVTADKLLLWRDDNINSRADAALSLRGTLEQARIGGNISIVESLFYKDIELLPLDVPVSMPKAPKLPKVSPTTRKKTTNSGPADLIPIPDPFGKWTLDVTARTEDPFLVRGNLTEGQVIGSLSSTGTLANPRLDGELTIKDFEAALPFSTLSIDGGKAVFTPDGGFIPKLDIRARSTIAPYDVNLFVAGKATSPVVSFSSNPPLPENEIITLVATGTTSAGLEDAEAAKGKAFQLLIEQIRRAPPGSPLHPLARFAEPLKDVELQVAGSDPFTGKRRNSVTIPIPDSTHWNVSAAVDSESNTRGLVIYLLRFN